MTKIYAMEKAYMTRLLSERKEIMSLIKGWTAEEMRAERSALIESCQAFITPKNAEESAKSYTVDDQGVAHIPIVGQLTPKAQTDACGAYTAEALTEYGFIAAASRAADADEYVSSIEYYVDSPGGYVSGLMPAVKAMREVKKPTTALVGGMAASAGYWLASQADSIIAGSDITRIGSIGVAVEEYDDTAMLEMSGITRRVFTSTDAPHKRPDTATEEGQMDVIQGLDDLHAIFAGQVAEGRGTTVENVNTNFGQGGIFTAQDALKRGMIDSIEAMPSRKDDTVQDVILEDTAAKAEETKQEVKVNTLDDLKKENSALYTEAVEAGVKQERERRNNITDVMKADPENAGLKAVCDAAIQEGTASDSLAFQTKVNVAIRDGEKLDSDNAPTVETQKDEESSTTLTEEEKSICKNLELSEESFLKEKRGEV